MEYAIPTLGAGPLAIALDQHDNVWFTESNASSLAVFVPSNRSFREIPVGKDSVEMWGLVHDSVGRVWFTVHSPKTNDEFVASYDTVAGQFRFFQLDRGSFPMRIMQGPDGNIWFTEFNASGLVKLEPSTGRITLYPTPEPGSGPAGLVADGEGKIWISLALKGSIASFDLQNEAFTIHKPGFPVFSPVGISVDGVGNVWFADHGGNWIVQFNQVANSFEKFPTSTPPAEQYPISIPNELKVAKNGDVWFCEHGGNKIGRLKPNDSTLIEYHVPTGPISTVLWFDFDSTGNVWFTEYDGNKIGVIDAAIGPPFTIALDSTSTVIVQGGSASTNLHLVNVDPTSPPTLFQASETGIDVHADFSTPEWPDTKTGVVRMELKADPDAKPTTRRVLVAASDLLVTVGDYLVVEVESGGGIMFPIQAPLLVGLGALVLAGLLLIIVRIRRRRSMQPTRLLICARNHFLGRGHTCPRFRSRASYLAPSWAHCVSYTPR
jgi:virginiamycin B lyase